jgi:peptidoglycan/LPS O-acetylase OafA/YrhL
MRNPESTLGRIPALDGIRGLAISLVLWWHVTSLSYVPNHSWLTRIIDLGRFTWSGVDLFFVLSGFLIGGILLDAVQSPSYFSTFYIRRAYRIVPLYAVFLLVVFAVLHRYGASHPWLGDTATFPYYVFFLQNFWMATTGSHGRIFLVITWSLAVEEQFYLTLPLTVRYVPRRVLYRVLVGVIIAAPVLRIVAAHLLNGKWLAAYVLMPCRADALCFGVLIAMATRNAEVWNKIVAHRGLLFTAFALSTGVGLWMTLSHFQPFTKNLFGLEYSLLATIYSLLVVSTLVSPSLSSVFSFAPLRFMGIVAYGVYLFHWPLIIASQQTVLYFYPASRGVTVVLAAMFAVMASVGLATISWKYFEKPLVERGYRHRFVRPLSERETNATAVA